jgi:hypothetical protein
MNRLADDDRFAQKPFWQSSSCVNLFIWVFITLDKTCVYVHWTVICLYRLLSLFLFFAGLLVQHLSLHLAFGKIPLSQQQFTSLVRMSTKIPDFSLMSSADIPSNPSALFNLSVSMAWRISA